MASGRRIVVAVDKSPECERAVSWARQHLYRDGDEFHLVHVVPRMKPTATVGAPPVDYLPEAATMEHDQVVAEAERFLAERFVPQLKDLHPETKVHIVTANLDSESIGGILCRKADELNAVAIVIASRSRSRFQEFFLGSVTQHVTHHSTKPVLVVH